MQPYVIVPAQGSDCADEWVRLGVEAQVVGQLPTAQQRYQQALRLDPRHAIAAQNLAIVFGQSSLLNEALLTIERAAMYASGHSTIYVNWSLMALEADRIDEALSAARRAVEMSPEDVPALVTLATVLTTAGLPSEAVPLYNRVLAIDPKHPAAGPNSCFIMTLTEATPKELLAQRQKWYAMNKYTGKIEPHKNDRNTERPLRVGYVGGDFKSHSAAFIFRRVVLHHTAAVEMYLYSTLPVDPAADSNTKRFKDVAGERWRDISTMGDDDAEKLVRQDRIDILVDLAAHTNGGRLSLFLRKPAPVQVTAWGFAHGTGCPEIDYFLADLLAVPIEERVHYAEEVVDLPCIVTMEPLTEYNLKGTSAAPCKKNDYVTFGCYARYEKLSDAFLRVVGEILRQVPESKIELKDHSFRRPHSIRRVMGLMPDIAPERLLFSLATSHNDHLLSYHQADLCLDPWPHGGGVVALEQLYMGVPLLTLYGTQPSGRSAASILAAMDRTDWIAKTPEEYVSKAVAMVNDLPALAKARKTLRQELLDSPVVKGYIEAVEAVYRDLWKRWVSK